MRFLRWLPLAASTLFACAAPTTAEDAEQPATATTDVALSASVEQLKSFGYDTGLVPSSGPAQVQLSVSAGGRITVNASGTPSAEGLTGKKGSGKVDVDLHLKLDGRSKVGGDEGDIPGLEDIDIAIKGGASFDPFVTDAKVDASIVASELPEIPLGGTPGKLRLAVIDGSVLHTTFTGTCLSVAGGKATYAGALTTSGTLRLNGKLVTKALGLEKEVDLGDIDVPIPETVTALDFAAVDAKGAKDAKTGTCGKAAPAPSTSNDVQDASKHETTPTKTQPTTPPATPDEIEGPPPALPAPSPKKVSCTSANGDYRSLSEIDFLADGDSIQITKMTVKVTNPNGRDQNDVDVYVNGKKAFNSGDKLVNGRTVEIPEARTLGVKAGSTLKLETNFDRALITDPSASCTISF